jgi:subtilase family serine protease
LRLTPAQIQKAYGLTALYKVHLDGTGQTIVILDWCGSPTIESDANAFSKQFGLPPLTAKNFQIIYTPTPSACAAEDPEINIDVEWAHAIAPGAAIDLVVPPSATFQDIDEGLFYSVDYQLGNSISGSFGSEELYTPETVLITENLIAETAAVLGISENFSSGDDGDFTFDDPSFNPPSVSAPADSPYATAVGGVSLFLTAGGTVSSQVGWGTNENLLYDEGFVPDPSAGEAFFDFGSGGGESSFFAKPEFQRALPGSGRQLPDISWLADPFTGGYIAISVPFATPELQYEVYGGTSLACPMFSALWAIANQAAGQPLGQAAPYLYSLPANAITDVVTQSSKTNVTGVVTDSSGKTSYTAAELAEVPGYTQPFVSAIWDYPLDEINVLLTFGTDSGLNVTKGWDNVTGVGTPNATDFVRAFEP